MKKIINIILVLFLVFSGWYFYQKSFQKVEKNLAEQITVNQSINNTPAKFTSYKIDNGKTALDLLKKTTNIETKGEGLNAYVIKIKGIEAKSDAKEYWAFYVNGKASTVGAGSYKLKSGDKIEWKIETY